MLKTLVQGMYTHPMVGVDVSVTVTLQPVVSYLGNSALLTVGESGFSCGIPVNG